LQRTTRVIVFPHRLLLVLLVLLASSSLDCTALPQPPTVLAADDQTLSVTGVVGTQVVPTRAVVSAPKVRPVVLRTRLDGNKTGAFLFPLEPRLGVVHRAGDHIQWGGHVGWLMNGLDLHYLPSGADGEAPVVLTMGAQASTPWVARRWPAFAWDTRAEVSVHPRLGRWQGMLGAGISEGRRKHVLEVPDGPLASYGVDRPWPVALHVARRETRIEGLIGVSVRVRRLTLALAVQPFYTLAAGRAVAAYCDNSCEDGLRLESFEATWGAAFTATLYAAPWGR
jgi:hypothetical protein